MARVFGSSRPKELLDFFELPLSAFTAVRWIFRFFFGAFEVVFAEVVGPEELGADGNLQLLQIDLPTDEHVEGGVNVMDAGGFLLASRLCAGDAAEDV